MGEGQKNVHINENKCITNEQNQFMECIENTKKNNKATKDWEEKCVQVTLSATALDNYTEKNKKQH